MSSFTTRWLPVALLTVVLGAVGTAVAWSVVASGKLPDGPADLVWDKTACAACGMHVGEPEFAAQATTKDGRVHAFDDPGCLVLWIEEQRPDLHSVFFRHRSEPRWIARDRTGFVPVEVSPMGFGFAAVDASAPGALDYDVYRARVLARTSGHGGTK